MNQYVLSVAAALDLDEIWVFIAQDDIDAADRWINKLFDAFTSLAKAPGMGHKRDDLTAFPILFWPVGAYLILYRVQDELIEIVAVTQGARDIPAFLSQRAQWPSTSSSGCFGAGPFLTGANLSRAAPAPSQLSHRTG